MDHDVPGASAAMLHVPQPRPYDHDQSQDHHSAHLSHRSSGRGGARGRGNRGRGRGKGPSSRPPTSDRSAPLQRPKVVMMPRMLADLLDEPKIALMHRVVNIAGPDIAWKTLLETLTIEEHGGLVVNADACGRPAHMMQANAPEPRRRTKGGVYLTMLKAHVPKETYKKIFEVEDDLKKKRKKHMRFVKHQKMESKINELPLHGLMITSRTKEEGEDGELTDDVAMAEAEP